MIRAAAGGAAVLVLVACAGCSDHSTHTDRSLVPRLIQLPAARGETTNRIGLAMEGARPLEVDSFGSMLVCLDRVGAVTIESVAPAHEQGTARIVAWAVRGSSNDEIGAEHGDLAHNGFRKAGRTVSQTCNAATGRSDELAVTLSQPDARGSVITDLTIHYVSQGRWESYVYPTTLAVCPHDVRFYGPSGEHAMCDAGPP